MRAYVMTTGVLFAFVAGVHVLKVIAEWPAVLHSGSDMGEPGIGVLGVVLALWAFKLLRAPQS